ncbi:ATP-binding protein [Sphingomonas sp. BIUV-7]|uniref:histidine kinase n=1 Tax=Sphingomonas natans TaxID=3063330 RepID=A0ABT8YEE2_9SPHN|nr:hybrid sensor histidine kinase/response regulator [Sphingomonas sp. BIUV-7]MDO6416710.1 ATP-binding protein [Sphingomonas sp. BIUV-7]
MPETGPSAGSDHVRKLLAAAGASGTWDWNISQNRLRIDAPFAELYGLDETQADTPLPTATFFKAVHPDDRARIRIAVAGMVAGAEHFSKEFRVVTADGTVLWVHGRGETHFDQDDQPESFTGLLIDVTERKRTEERLRVAQSAGGVGTFEYSDGFATVAVSSEFCRLLGLHPANILPVRTINAVLTSADAGMLIPEAPHGAQMETLDGTFCVIRNDDGERRWITRRGEILHDGDGGYRLIGVIYDVTAAKAQEAALRDLNETLETRIETALAERQLIEDALRQAQKMEAVGNLTGGIAHDFNNLLTIIIGNIDTVLRRSGTDRDPREQRSLGNALKGAERAAALTQRLLAFSRRQPLAPKTIDIARLLTGMSDLLTRSIAETIAIRVVAAPDLWAVEADPNQLENVILNLAVNARDAMPDGGPLTIEAKNEVIGADAFAGVPDGAYVVVSVSDDGMGMAPETVAQVFDPFFTTKEVGKGTGLGLSMVYGFAKQSGGHVHIRSALGAGTTVSLFLPRQQGAAESPDEPDAVAAERGRPSETVLVVEDDEDVRAYTVGVLRELGYHVMEAVDGITALQVLGRDDQPISLLLTDVVMPSMSGTELADAARSLRPELKVLFMSGYPRDTISPDGRIQAGVDLLSKPFTFASLSQKLRQVMDHAEG